MQSFCRVVETGSFTHAAGLLGLSTAVVSRQVAALEAHLGVRLLERSTRLVELSEAGQQYYPRCLELLEQLGAIEAQVGGLGEQPSGLLRVSAPMDYGRLYLRPAIRAFLSAHSEVRIELHLDDRPSRLLEEGIDVAIRIGRLPDSTLVARKLGEACIGCYASPDYLAQHGEPQSPADLLQHKLLDYTLGRPPGLWRFQPHAEDVDIGNRWRISVNNGRTLADFASRGMGIARLPELLVQDYLADGRLLEILQAFRSAPLDISALYLQRRFNPAKITAFCGFIAEFLNDIE